MFLVFACVFRKKTAKKVSESTCFALIAVRLRWTASEFCFAKLQGDDKKRKKVSGTVLGTARRRKG